jgi:TonB family protein
MITGTDSPRMEVSVRHFLIAKSNILFVSLAVAALLISAIVAASPNPSTQEEHPSSPPKIDMGIAVLSYLPPGVNPEPYMRNLHSSVIRSLSAKLPESFANGKKGIVVTRVQVRKDGSLSDDAMTIATSSGKKDMDDASLSAIRAAAPFGLLPEGYPDSSLDLKFTFYYGIAPAQKPKVVPAG